MLPIKLITKNLFSALFVTVLIMSQATTAQAALPPSIGQISPPPGVDVQNEFAQNSGAVPSDGIAIFFFLSNMVKIVSVVAGVYVMYNLVMAAFTYLTGQGKAESHTKVRDLLTMSAVGLLLIVLAYTITAVLSLLLLGDASYILSPTLQGPTP